MFYKHKDWNVEAHSFIEGLPPSFYVATISRDHFDAKVEFDWSKQSVKMTWSEGHSDFKHHTFYHLANKANLDEVLQGIEAGITKNMIEEAYVMREQGRQRGYILND